MIYLIPKFNGAIVEVLECMYNFILHYQAGMYNQGGVNSLWNLRCHVLYMFQHLFNVVCHFLFLNPSWLVSFEYDKLLYS